LIQVNVQPGFPQILRSGMSALGQKQPCPLCANSGRSDWRVRQLHSESHQQPWAEPSFGHSYALEAARGVETQGVRVADHMQSYGTNITGIGGAMIDQRASNAAFPKGRFDEQSVKFDLAVFAGQHHRKTRHRPISLGDEYLPSIKLL